MIDEVFIIMIIAKAEAVVAEEYLLFEFGV
jgi:hypothetical protein